MTPERSEAQFQPAAELDRQPVSARRRILAMMTTLMIVSVAGIGGLEVVWRLFLPVTDQYWYFWDPALGPRIEPNQSGRLIRADIFNAAYHFNEQGWNHPDSYSTIKPKGARRVCIIGDSQVESLQVDADKTMFAVAQRQMTRSDRPVQWYAFANSGWGTNMAYEAIRHYALDYEPDVVVLLFIQNDPFDCSPYLVDVGDIRPVYYLNQSEELVLIPPSPSWRPSRRARFASQSALFRYFMFQKQVYEKLVALQSGTTSRPGIGGLPLMAEGQTGQASLVPGVDAMSMEKRQAMTWRLVEKLLEACRNECRYRGTTFAVAFRGWTDEIEAPLTGKDVVQETQQKDPYCLTSRYSEMGREWVGPICSKLQIPYLDLTDALRTAVANTAKSHVFVDENRMIVDNHYNAMAHEVVGHAMADWVEPLLETSQTQSPK
jgi:hypothetical protein